MKAINFFLVALITLATGFLSVGAEAAEKQTLENHEVVTWNPGDKVEIFMPFEFFECAPTWKRIRRDPKSQQILEDENTVVHIVPPYWDVYYDGVPYNKDYYTFTYLAYLIGRDMAKAQKSDLIEFLDRANYTQGEEPTHMEFAEAKGWMPLDKARDLVQQRAKEAGMDPEEYSKKILAPYAEKDPDKFKKISKELAAQGIDIIPSPTERLRYPIFVNGKPAPYLFYDMKN